MDVPDLSGPNGGGGPQDLEMTQKSVKMVESLQRLAQSSLVASDEDGQSEKQRSNADQKVDGLTQRSNIRDYQTK